LNFRLPVTSQSTDSSIIELAGLINTSLAVGISLLSISTIGNINIYQAHNAEIRKFLVLPLPFRNLFDDRIALRIGLCSLIVFRKVTENHD
jgi:hypothetical protein